MTQGMLSARHRTFRALIAAAAILGLTLAGASPVRAELHGIERLYRSAATEWSLIQSLLENRAYADAFTQLDAFRASLDRLGVGRARSEALALLVRTRAVESASAPRNIQGLLQRAATLDPETPAVAAASGPAASSSR